MNTHSRMNNVEAAEYFRMTVPQFNRTVKSMNVPFYVEPGSTVKLYRLDDLNRLFVRTEDTDGFLYVVEFSTGVVKVGQTTKPTQRIGSHTKHAHAVGISVVRTWITPGVVARVTEKERAVIDRCRQHGTARAAEYFDGLDFADVVSWVMESAQ